MKVWDEEEILQELVASRLAEVAEANAMEAAAKHQAKNTNNNKRKKTTNNNSQPSYTDKRRKLPFLLILVRKVQRKCYEFLYCPAETYERIDQVFQLTTIETDDGALSATDEEGAVWTNGHASASGGSSSDEDDEDDDEPSQPFEPYYVGKAIFHTASGEVLLKCEGSIGWREALKENYHGLDARAKILVERQLTQSSRKGRNHTAAKAVASAAAGTSLAMGYTAATAGTAVATEAAAAGSITATMQTLGTVAVVANPLGMVAAGAVGGLGAYYWIHRRNKHKKKQRQEKEKMQQLEAMAQELVNAQEETDEPEQSTSTNNEYQRLSKEDPAEEQQAPSQQPTPEEEESSLWVLVAAKRIELEESDHCMSHEAYEDRVDADQHFLEVTSNTAAKALFDPRGVLRRVDCDPNDRDGWETALSLHYNYLVEQDLIAAATSKHGEDNASEDTPLLLREEQGEETQL